MSASGSLNSPVLGLPRLEVASFDLRQYSVEVDLENALNQARQNIDQMVGLLTGTCYTDFHVSSSFDGLAGGADVGSAYTRQDRVIQEVVAWAGASGSGGVTTIDVQVQGPAGNFCSIFGPLGAASNAAMRPALSSSLGNYGIARSGQTLMVSGSNMVWKAGTLMKCLFTTAAGAVDGSAQKNIDVYVHWSPSGSFPNSTAAP